MKIVVLVKQTFDTEARIELDSEGKIADLYIKKVINPYDELAIEEAVRIKEKMKAEITVVTLGPAQAEDALKQALAMGADKAVLVSEEELREGDDYSRARVLADVIGRMDFDLILGGWVSIDHGSAQIPARIAEILGIPQITVVTNLQISDNTILAQRETDEGMEIIATALPALITVQKGINEPRYPTFKGIMQAKKKELKKVSLAELTFHDNGDSLKNDPKVVVKSICLPLERGACKLFEGETAEACRHLAEALHRETKVI